MKQSNRTKNRIREHSLVLDRNKTSENVHGFAGKKMIFATCQSCDWFGWLPEEEITDQLSL